MGDRIVPNQGVSTEDIPEANFFPGNNPNETDGR